MSRIAHQSAGVRTTGSTISFSANALAGTSGNTNFSLWTQLQVLP
jgi:hypothetical protein